MMMIDHAIKFLNLNTFLSYVTVNFVTVVSQPLFVFCTGYLYAISKKTFSFNSRYFQIFISSLIVSTIWSIFYKKIQFDILFNYLILLPIFPFIFKYLSTKIKYLLIFTIAFASSCPFKFEHFDIQFGPALVLFQMILASFYIDNQKIHEPFFYWAIGLLSFMVGVFVHKQLGFEYYENGVYYWFIGIPFGIVISHFIMNRSFYLSKDILKIFRFPLSIYCSHIFVFFLFSYT